MSTKEAVWNLFASMAAGGLIGYHGPDLIVWLLR